MHIYTTKMLRQERFPAFTTLITIITVLKYFVYSIQAPYNFYLPNCQELAVFGPTLLANYF